MNHFARVLVTVLFSVGIAAILSLLSASAGSYRTAGESAVFRHSASADLTENNLVDALAGLPLHLKIRKALLADSILTVDLSAVPGVATAADVYHDLYELARFGRNGTANVSRLMVRVLEPAGNGLQPSAGQLLLAMDSRKDGDAARPVTNRTTGGKDQVNVWREYLQTYSAITYSNRWKNQFGL